MKQATNKQTTQQTNKQKYNSERNLDGTKQQLHCDTKGGSSNGTNCKFSEISVSRYKILAKLNLGSSFMQLTQKLRVSGYKK